MKNKFTRVLVITSCISPNTKLSDLSKFTIENRAKELVVNIKSVYESKLFKKIIVVDASPKNSLPKNDTLKNYLKCHGGLDTKEIQYVNFHPKKELKQQIYLKGAGLSETKMMLYGLKKIKIQTNTIIFKLSGRYFIRNLINVIRNIEELFSNDANFCMPISEIFSKTSSILYAFSDRFPIEIFEEICDKVSDSEGLYVEHLFYSEVFLNSFIKSQRMKLMPIYPYELEGGHNQGKYTRIKQLLNNIIFKYL